MTNEKTTNANAPKTFASNGANANIRPTMTRVTHHEMVATL